jgi:hypothetical protein
MCISVDRGQAALGDIDRHATQRVDRGIALAVSANDITGGDDGFKGGVVEAGNLDDGI